MDGWKRGTGEGLFPFLFLPPAGNHSWPLSFFDSDVCGTGLCIRPMKNFFALILCLIAPAVFAGGSSGTFLVNISGTVYKPLSSEEGTRPVATPLNNRRIFAEFDVSPDDYALVITLDGEGLILLVPKSGSVKLPVITVLALDGARSIPNTRTGVILFESPVFNSNESGNIFSNMRGTIFGSLKLNEGEGLQRFNANVTGSSASGPIVKTVTAKGIVSTTTLLKFKVTRGRPFVQEP
jgi:hypothetical protein